MKTLKSILAWPLHLFLFLLAWLLFLPLSLVNFICVVFTARDHAKGYFINSALNLDILANREFRTFWNLTLRKSNGYKFGLTGETISSALGKNKRDGTLSSVGGKILAFIVDALDKNHCIKSITDRLKWPNT
ncbi:hypothetical protein D9M68_367430 [compost metagenome]